MPRYKIDIQEGPFQGRSFMFEGEKPPTDNDIASHLSTMQQPSQEAQQIGTGVRGASGRRQVFMPHTGGAPIDVPDPSTTGVGRAIDKVASFGLPIAGGIIGARFGGIGGGIAGSAAGTAASQGMGFEPVDPAQIALSGAANAIPLIGRIPGVKQVGGKIADFIPGVKDVKLHDVAEKALPFVDKAIKLTPAAPLWAQVKRLGATTLPAMPTTVTAVKEAQREVGMLAQGIPGVKDLSKMVNSLAFKFNKPTTFEAVDANIKALGKAIGKMEREGGVELGRAKKLLSSMYDDLQSAPLNVPGSQLAQANAARQAAVDASKREFAKEEITTAVHKAVTPVSGQGDLLKINPADVLKKLRGMTDPVSPTYDKNLVTSLAAELPEIEKFFLQANKIMGKRGEPGSLVIQNIAAGAAVGTASAVLGAGPAMSAMAAAAGAQTPKLLAEVLASPVGRKIILEGLHPDIKFISPQLVNTAWQAIRAITPDDLQSTQQPAEEVVQP